MTILEIIGTIFALLGVFLTVRQNIWCWPVAIVALLIYIYIFFKSKLYGDMGLQVIYIIASIYGWHEWKYGRHNEQELKVHRISSGLLFLLCMVSTAGTILLGWFLDSSTDTDVPYLDAGLTVFSLLATWMMARKHLEHWIFWIVLDLVYVGLYLYKDLHVTAFQYFIFTALAIYGFIAWKKELKKASIA